LKEFSMLNKVRKTIVRYAMLAQGERLIAAVSGGSDSVALLKVLTLLAPEYQLSLVVAHLNHGLRGDEADREEDFVRRLSGSMGLPYVSKKVDIAGLREQGKSLEEVCRDQRYAFLRKAAADCGAAKIALGHHLRDQAETVLMNLLRGSGAGGLRGMPPVREGMIVRPLLHVSREEILAFLEERGLPFMHDSSNDQDCYYRNRIRRHLLPFLRENFNPRIEENLFRTAEILRQEDEYLEEEVKDWLNSQGVFCRDEEPQVQISELLLLHEALQRRILKTLMIRTCGSGKAIGFTHVQAALALAAGVEGSASLNLPGGAGLQREYGLLIFSRRSGRRASSGEGPGRTLEYCYPVSIPGRVEVREAGMAIDFRLADSPRASCRIEMSERIAYLDYDALCPPLVIRNVRPGDRMQQLGMTGRKKIQALFIDEKVPRARRHLCPLLADQQSVIWIAGLRISARASITENTRQVLQVEII